MHRPDIGSEVVVVARKSRENKFQTWSKSTYKGRSGSTTRHVTLHRMRWTVRWRGRYNELIITSLVQRASHFVRKTMHGGQTGKRARKNQRIFFFFHRLGFLSRGATRNARRHTRERPFWLDASRRASCSSSRWRSSNPFFFPPFPHGTRASPFPFPPYATLCSPLLRVFSPSLLSLPLRFISLLSSFSFLSKEEEKKRGEKKKERKKGKRRPRRVYTGEVIKGVGVYSLVLYPSPLLETPRCSRGTRGTRGSVAEQSFRELWSFLGYTPPSIPHTPPPFHQPRTHSPRRGPNGAYGVGMDVTRCAPAAGREIGPDSPPT